MTTVAYKNGELAADTQVVSGGAMQVGEVNKLAMSSCGQYMGGACGELINVSMFLKWVTNGADRRSWPKLTDDFKGLLVHKDGSVRIASYKGLSRPVNASHFTIGSGEEVAGGAFVVGATAKEAVQAAIAVDLYTGGSVDLLTFKD